jgi:hypothetical protein
MCTRSDSLKSDSRRRVRKATIYCAGVLNFFVFSVSYEIERFYFALRVRVRSGEEEQEKCPLSENGRERLDKFYANASVSSLVVLARFEQYSR